MCNHLKEFIQARAIADPFVVGQFYDGKLPKGKELKALEQRLKTNQEDESNRVHPRMSEDMKNLIRKLTMGKDPQKMQGHDVNDVSGYDSQYIGAPGKGKSGGKKPGQGGEDPLEAMENEDDENNT